MGIEIYKVDRELSKELYEVSKDYINSKDCYNNVAKIVACNSSKLNEEGIKVAFGAWSIPASNEEDVYLKHCFLVNSDNKVIDPMIYLGSLKESKIESAYIIIESYEVEEYMEKLLDNDGYIERCNFFKSNGLDLYKSFKEEGIMLV